MSCGRNCTLYLREDVSEMEIAAKKFESEAGIFEEINRQPKSSDDCSLYSLSNRVQDEDGYFHYCPIDFDLISKSNETTPHNQGQEYEPVSRLNSEVSEISTSCVASTHYSSTELTGSPITHPNNVKYSFT